MSNMINKIDNSSKFGRCRQGASRGSLLRSGVVLGALALGLGLQWTPAAVAASAPAVVTMDAWTIDFKPGPLKLYYDPETSRTFRYFTYRVINGTGKDHMFAPRIELFLDKGLILLSGRGVPSEVTKRLRILLNDPLLEDENQILGDLKQGKEHAKDGLVIWPDTDLSSNDLTIFVTGLSNDTIRVPHPQTDEEVLLRKTLRLDYHIPGNALDRPREQANPISPASTERAIQLHERIPNGLWIWR